MRIFIITVICLALAAPAWAGMYKWTDKDGKIHFTDNPSRIPVDSRNKKSMKKMKASKAIKQSSSSSSPASRHSAAKSEGPQSGSSGVDKQRVNELLRLNQKKHYNH